MRRWPGGCYGDSVSPQLHSAAVARMDPTTLYRLLQLRTDVFVVEQQCAYPELDGRDLEAGSLMLWASEDEAVVATLRILRDPDALRIGRVAALPSHRGSGIAGRLFRRALDECAGIAPALPIVLDAQQPLEAWYGRFGFERTGEAFLEDGIPHVPMRRAGAEA